MIRNQWYVVLEANEVKVGRPLGVTRLGEKLVFWRQSDGSVICMRDTCPHLGAQLHQGKVKGDRLACPFHGFEYDAEGRCRYLPAYGQNGEIPKALRAATYPTYENHDLIWIYWGEPTGDLRPPKFFEAIHAGCSYQTVKQHWAVHYSRMIENQLDVAHVPFVHSSTIGRGLPAVVDGPQVRLEDDLLEVWPYYRPDDGTPPRKAEDLPAPSAHPLLQFRFPNTWHNWLGDDLHIFLAFVPIDEENGIAYLRGYQAFVRLPLLRDLVNLFMRWGNTAVINQDKRMVLGQTPKKSSLKMGEKIMQCDRAILTYRRHRHQLLEANGQL